MWICPPCAAIATGHHLLTAKDSLNFHYKYVTRSYCRACAYSSRILICLPTPQKSKLDVSVQGQIVGYKSTQHGKLPISDPPENCHLNVKICQDLTFFFNCQKQHFLVEKKRHCLAFFKWQVFGNFLTFKWQFSGGSASNLMERHDTDNVKFSFVKV